MLKVGHKLNIILLLLLIGLLTVGCGDSDSATAEDVSVEDSLDTVDETPEVTEDVEGADDDAIDDSETVNEAEDEIVEEEIVEPEEPIGPNSMLTGLPIHQEAYDTRPIGVMISNIETAMPQFGISDADIIYEVMVEGGITRLFALFQDFDTEKIGPIRSSRHYFLDLAIEHDAIYTHVGQSVYATEAFKKLDVDRFYGISYLDLILTYQDEERNRPHSTFTSYDHLMATWDEVGYEREADYEQVKFTFNQEGVTLEEGEDVNKILLDYSGMYHTNPYFLYNDEDGLYYRYQYETEHMDALYDEQLKFKNVIVQYVTTWWIKDDTNGCIDMSLISEGKGMYLTNGKMVPITWSKTDQYGLTEYFLEDGSKIELNPGKTFVSIFPKHNVDKIVLE